MVEIQRIHAAIIAAPLTSTALVFDGHLANLLPSFTDGVDEVGATILVRPLSNRHLDAPTLFTVTRSTN